VEQGALLEIIDKTEGGPLVSYVDRFVLREKIASLESSIAKCPQAEIPLKHSFSKGVYAREITIPKGSLIVGKIHKHQNMNIISKGEVSFFSIDGAVRVKAPHTFVASPGVKRVIFAHEDTVWTTIHGTNETDLDKIENEFIAKSYDDLYLNSKRGLDDVLEILGASAEELKAISENTDDQIPFPRALPLTVRKSAIHGLGLFAECNYVSGEKIAPARIDGKRTPAGRYINHWHKPNAQMAVNKRGDVDVVAIVDIPNGEEILTDYYFNFTQTRSLPCRG
jgi:hypothetical protein